MTISKYNWGKSKNFKRSTLVEFVNLQTSELATRKNFAPRRNNRIDLPRLDQAKVEWKQNERTEWMRSLCGSFAQSPISRVSLWQSRKKMKPLGKASDRDNNGLYRELERTQVIWKRGGRHFASRNVGSSSVNDGLSTVRSVYTGAPLSSRPIPRRRWTGQWTSLDDGHAWCIYRWGDRWIRGTSRGRSSSIQMGQSGQFWREKGGLDLDGERMIHSRSC